MSKARFLSAFAKFLHGKEWSGDGLDALHDLDERVADLENAPSPVFTESYVSDELTISQKGTGTLTLGLSAAPKLVQVRIVCKTADQGYAVGDQIVLGTMDTSNGRGLMVVLDGDSLYYRFVDSGSVFSAWHKTNGDSVSLTNANWRMVVRAWA